jgi:hypothetical protein
MSPNAWKGGKHRLPAGLLLGGIRLHAAETELITAAAPWRAYLVSGPILKRKKE